MGFFDIDLDFDDEPKKKKYLGDSRQKKTEKELKAKAQQGKKLRGQQTLTSAVSTSRHDWFTLEGVI